MLAYAIGKPKDVLEIERPPESPMGHLTTDGDRL